MFTLFDNVTAAADMSASHADASTTISQTPGLASSACPSSANDVMPPEWWRTMPAYHFDDARHLLLHATVDKISAMRGRPCSAALRHDAAACAAAALLLSLIRPRTPLDHLLAIEPSMNWLIPVLQRALQEERDITTAENPSRRLCSRAGHTGGDFS